MHAFLRVPMRASVRTRKYVHARRPTTHPYTYPPPPLNPTHTHVDAYLLATLCSTGTDAAAAIQDKHGTLRGRNGICDDRLVVKGA